MLELNLSEPLEQRLLEMAREAGQSPNEFALTALKAYMENLEDYQEAVDALKEHREGGGKTYSLEEVMNKLGLDS